MKKLIVIVIALAILVSCASQKSWHIKYLEKDLKAHKDSLNSFRQIATQAIIEERNKHKATITAFEDFILITDKSIADSLLIKHKMKYQFKDGTIIGK